MRSRVPVQSKRKKRRNDAIQRATKAAVRRCHTCGRASLMRSHETEIGIIRVCRYCGAEKIPEQGWNA